MVDGSNEKSFTETATVPFPLASAHAAPAADAAADGAPAADAAAEEPPPPDDEQAEMTRAIPPTMASIRRSMHASFARNLSHHRTARIAARFRRGYRGADTTGVIGTARDHMIDAATMRWLLLHEARIHAIPGRDLRDLGDAILLHDAVEAEPFWNRLEGLSWPSDPTAFDRRLTEILVLFASLGRTPHIWGSPLHDSPGDLVARLEANGFRDLGLNYVMLLTDPAAATDPQAAGPPPGVTLERLSMVDAATVEDAKAAIATVLIDAFDVELGRAAEIEGETAALLQHPWFTHYLARVDGVPAAAARGATFEGATYLSSIGTAAWARGRGLGGLVTRAAVQDAVKAGSRWTYLGVLADNRAAMTVYERAGFSRLGGAAADLLLV